MGGLTVRLAGTVLAVSFAVGAACALTSMGEAAEAAPPVVR